MIRRKVYTLLAVGTLALLAVSATAVAQPDPVVVRAWPSFTSTPPDPVELDSSLRNTEYTLDINLAVDGTFHCAAPVSVEVEIVMENFPGYAGMSLVPDGARTATFEVSGTGPWGPEPVAGPTFDIAWQDDAPTNETVEYKVIVAGVRVDSQQGAEPCVGNPTISSAAGNAQTGTALINVTRPWTPPEEGESEVDCTIEPENPACRDTGGPAEGGDSPGLGAIIVIGALAAAAIAARRRQ